MSDEIFIGNYKLIEEIDCGSFGCVYLVQHRFLTNRFAAMKLLYTTRLHSRRVRERFLQEARFLEKLKHHHILSIYDCGFERGTTPYIVTEHASGGSLRDLLMQRPRRRLPVGQAISILTQVGEALHYAHQNGIIHHDVKPENILFNAQGEVLLADFGIAMMQELVIRQRATASIGTPAYMAPEQFRGYVSRRSDQYSLACVAYEMFTGRPPFIVGHALALGLKHRQELPVPPSQLNPRVPLYIEQAILKALEKRRMNRYENVQQFIEALQDIDSAVASVPSISQPMILHPRQQTRRQRPNDNTLLSSLKRLLAMLF